MSTALHIKYSSDPIINNWRLEFFTFKIPKFSLSEYIFSRLRSNLNLKIDNFQLAMEGLLVRSKNYSPQQAKENLDLLSPVILQLQEQYEKLRESSALFSPEVKKSYRAALKATYRLESSLHKIAYQNSDFLKTDSELKECLAENSRNVIQRLNGVN